MPALAAGAILLAVLLATAPARLLVHFLPAEQVLLQGLSGTLWQGGASRALLRTDAGYFHLGQLHWRVRPLSLLLLSPAVVFESSWAAQQLEGELRQSLAGTLTLTDAEGRLGAGLAARFLPVRLGGEFSLQLARLELRDGMPQAVDGRLVWQGASWAAPQGERSLGDYVAELETLADGSIVARVLTLSGELSAEGTARWQDGSYALDLLLQGPGLDDPQMQQALQLMASPEADGFRLRLEGAL